MNIQQSDKLMDRIKTMEVLVENENHEWLLGWFTPTINDLSTKEVVEKMNQTWRKFRAYCKRNDIQLQWFRRIKLGNKNHHPIFELGIFVSKESLETIREILSQQFEIDDYKSITQQPVPNKSTTQYIEKYFSKSHTPEEQERLRNIAGARLQTYLINQ